MSSKIRYPDGTLLPIGIGAWEKTDFEKVEVLVEEYNERGWQAIADSVKTSGSPLALTADADTKLTLDGLGAGSSTEHMPKTTPHEDGFWDLTNNKLFEFEGAALSMEIDFRATPTAGATDGISMWFMVNGTESHLTTFTFPRGQGVEEGIVFSSTIGIDALTALHGAEIYIRSNGGTSTAHSFHLSVTRVYYPRGVQA